jgi:hypothetical protein
MVKHLDFLAGRDFLVNRINRHFHHHPKHPFSKEIRRQMIMPGRKYPGSFTFSPTRPGNPGNPPGPGSPGRPSVPLVPSRPRSPLAPRAGDSDTGKISWPASPESPLYPLAPFRPSTPCAKKECKNAKSNRIFFST